MACAAVQVQLHCPAWRGVKRTASDNRAPQSVPDVQITAALPLFLSSSALGKLQVPGATAALIRGIVCRDGGRRSSGATKQQVKLVGSLRNSEAAISHQPAWLLPVLYLRSMQYDVAGGISNSIKISSISPSRQTAFSRQCSRHSISTSVLIAEQLSKTVSRSTTVPFMQPLTLGGSHACVLSSHPPIIEVGEPSIDRRKKPMQNTLNSFLFATQQWPSRYSVEISFVHLFYKISTRSTTQGYHNAAKKSHTMPQETCERRQMLFVSQSPRSMPTLAVPSRHQ